MISPLLFTFMNVCTRKKSSLPSNCTGVYLYGLLDMGDEISVEALNSPKKPCFRELKTSAALDGCMLTHSSIQATCRLSHSSVRIDPQSSSCVTLVSMRHAMSH